MGNDVSFRAYREANDLVVNAWHWKGFQKVISICCLSICYRKNTQKHIVNLLQVC